MPAQATQPPESGALDEELLDPVWLRRLAASLEQLAGTDARTRLASVVNTTRPFDATDLVETLRAEFKLLPYRGLLNGAAGVALTYEGNSLDMSLLLYDVLQEAGRSVRLASIALVVLAPRWMSA